jgi:hypothetical protein
VRGALPPARQRRPDLTGRRPTPLHFLPLCCCAESGALVEDLVKSLDKFKVPAREKGELLGALGGMKPAIVNK